LKKLAILGSTGSIGQSTLSIVEQFPERYSVAALAAGRNIDEAFAQANRWRPKIVSVVTEELAARLASRLREAGVSEEHLGRLSSPIGLDLGARTPEETAVSIAAEIIASRWGGQGQRLTGLAGRIHHDAMAEP